MSILKDLSLIDIKEGPSAPISYVLMFNPYHVARAHYEAGRVNEALFNLLKQRMIEIGADGPETPSSAKEKAR